MDTKAAVKLIETYGFKVVGWNGTFTEARVKRPTGEIAHLPTTGGKAKLSARLDDMKKPIKPPHGG